jgi:hypothetical protein
MAQAQTVSVAASALFAAVVFLGCIAVWDKSTPGGGAHDAMTREKRHFDRLSSPQKYVEATLDGVRAEVERRGLATPLGDANTIARIRRIFKDADTGADFSGGGLQRPRQRHSQDDAAAQASPSSEVADDPNWQWIAPAHEGIAAHGCKRVHLEKLMPGGFGASMMRVVFGVRDNWLDRGKSLMISP